MRIACICLHIIINFLWPQHCALSTSVQKILFLLLDFDLTVELPHWPTSKRIHMGLQNMVRFEFYYFFNRNCLSGLLAWLVNSAIIKSCNMCILSTCSTINMINCQYCSAHTQTIGLIGMPVQGVCKLTDIMFMVIDPKDFQNSY